MMPELGAGHIFHGKCLAPNAPLPKRRRRWYDGPGYRPDHNGVLRTMLCNKVHIVVGCVLAAAMLSGAKADNTGSPAKAEYAETINEGAEKTYDFKMRDASWNRVFQQFVDISGQEVCGSSLKGTFTFIPPKGKKYTLEEITDIINEALQTRDFMMISSGKRWFLVPTDDKSDGFARHPRVRPEDLGNFGKYEVASVKIPLANLTATDLQDAERMLGPIGNLAVDEALNQVFITDTAGNLRQV